MHNKDNRPWYVYIIRCAHTSLYTGISPNVARRVQMHREGKGAKYTKNKSPLELVYVEKQENLHMALAMERKIKSLSKKKKEALIQGFDTSILASFITEKKS